MIYSLILQKDDTWEVLNNLGGKAHVSFMELNKDKMPHEKKFAKTVKHIEEINKKIE